MIGKIIVWLLLYLLLYAGCLTFYLRNNNGIRRGERRKQIRRYIPDCLIALLPCMAMGAGFSYPVLFAACVSILTAVSFIRVFHIAHRNNMSEYDHHYDISTGLYLFALLCSLLYFSALITIPILPQVLLGIVSLLESFFFFVSLFVVIYYVLYHTCVEYEVLQVILDTNVNEVIEYFKSLPKKTAVLYVFLIIAFVSLPFVVNFTTSISLLAWKGCEVLLAVIIAYVLYNFLKKKNSLLKRWGMIELYLTVREYVAANRRYRETMQRRQESLEVKSSVQEVTPCTYMLVIGESATRDFMSAFGFAERDTTPWLRSSVEKDPAHFLLFPNAYSCATQTVPVMQRFLTEANQYNKQPFYDSTTIVEVARKLGFKIHWYSNQGHLGSADTPVTLVADNADVAKWTRQVINHVPYDEALLEFLDEVDPSVNNLVVLHLKGNHFNYNSRYPSSFSKWSSPDQPDDELDYQNSLLYTDDILRRFYEYGTQKLNMKAMVYISDHGTIPKQRRTVTFTGFGMVRVPMFMWLSDDYQKCHALRYEALKQNQSRYFTNDLTYELMCGLMDVESAHFEESNSIASTLYRYQREDLLTDSGRVRISDDL